MDLGNPGPILFAAEGLTGIRDDFFLLLRDEIRRRKGVDTLYEVKIVVEDIIHELTDRYSERVGERDPIGVLMGGLDRIGAGKATMYFIHSPGYGELRPFVCTGHGAPYAYSLAKFLCDVRGLSVEDAAARAAFVISWISAGDLDSYVGGKPQVCMLRDGKPTLESLGESQVDKHWNEVQDHQKTLAKLFGLSLL